MNSSSPCPFPTTITITPRAPPYNGTTSHTIKVVSKLKNFDNSFRSDNHFIELADGTRTKGVGLKRGDAEICLVDMGGNHVTVSLKGALYITSYPQNILSVMSATANGATMVYLNGTKFKIYVYNRLYYLSTEKKLEDSCQGCYDIHT